VNLNLARRPPAPLRKVDPRALARTPVVLVVEIGAVATTVMSIPTRHHG
jgi:K+-transporting ATPase ATPase B chain